MVAAALVLRVNAADDFTGNSGAWDYWIVTQNNYVERVAIIRQRVWDIPIIVGEHIRVVKDAVQYKTIVHFVVFVFDIRAFADFNKCYTVVHCINI